MKATVSRTAGFSHEIDIRTHGLQVDESIEDGGDDQGPSPQELLAASLASCMAITIVMYGERKGWDVGPLQVECEYEQPERGSPTEIKLTIRLSSDLAAEQVDRLAAIAAKCPVHRTLEREIRFDQRVERL
jgi:putative redox protein